MKNGLEDPTAAFKDSGGFGWEMVVDAAEGTCCALIYCLHQQNSLPFSFLSSESENVEGIHTNMRMPRRLRNPQFPVHLNSHLRIRG